MKPQAAILTGDLIGSTAAPPKAVEDAMGALSEVAFRFGSNLSRFRGDGWQFLVPNPGLGLWALILTAAQLRSANGLISRIALGVGDINWNRPNDLSSANGTALVASGRALDTLKESEHYALAGDGVDPLHCRLVQMIGERLDSWSKEQAEAMALAIAPEDRLTQEEIAWRIGISRQAVAARLRAADYAQLSGAINDFQRTFGLESPHA